MSKKSKQDEQAKLLAFDDAGHGNVIRPLVFDNKQAERLALIEALFGQRIVAAYLLTGTLGSAR